MKFIIRDVYVIALFTIGFVGVGAASAQDASMSPDQDLTFVKQAASGGITEVALGQLAQQKGTSLAVIDFGKRMQRDHSEANDQLNSVTSRDQIMVPSGMDQQDQPEYNRLSQLSGSDFDKAYAEAMVQDHEKDIAAFRQEASSGRNSDVKNFAAQTLPTLESHLQAAEAMEKSVNAITNC